MQLTEIADVLNIPVLAYGLRSDFMGEPFEGSRYLLAWAEELTEIKTVCHCGKKATMNMRIDKHGNNLSSGAQVQIGGNESYISTCRVHFKQGDSGHIATNFRNLLIKCGFYGISKKSHLSGIFW